MDRLFKLLNQYNIKFKYHNNILFILDKNKYISIDHPIYNTNKDNSLITITNGVNKWKIYNNFTGIIITGDK